MNTQDSPEKFLKLYEEKLASQDWSSVESLVHPNAVFIFSEGTYQGRGEIEKAFRRTFALIKEERYPIENINWILKEKEIALCSYVFRWSGIIKGAHCSGGGRGSSTLVRHENQWVIIHEHLGPGPHLSR